MEIEQSELISKTEEDGTTANIANLDSEDVKGDDPRLDELTDIDVEPVEHIAAITERDSHNDDLLVPDVEEIMENVPELKELKCSEIETELTEPIAGIRIDEPQVISMQEESWSVSPEQATEEEIKIETPETTESSVTETVHPASVTEDLDIILDEEISQAALSEQDQSSMSATESNILESENTPNIDETSMDSGSVCSETVTVLKRSARNAEKAKNEASVSPTKPPTTRNKFSRDKALFDEMKFMADFDPTRSNRNKEKKRKRYTDGRQQLIADHYDDCDCLLKNCPGCHFPCKRCGDRRCGHECRQGRRWLYESIEVEGRGIELRNPHVNN